MYSLFNNVTIFQSYNLIILQYLFTFFIYIFETIFFKDYFVLLRIAGALFNYLLILKLYVSHVLIQANQCFCLIFYYIIILIGGLNRLSDPLIWWLVLKIVLYCQKILFFILPKLFILLSFQNQNYCTLLLQTRLYFIVN